MYVGSKHNLEPLNLSLGGWLEAILTLFDGSTIFSPNTEPSSTLDPLHTTEISHS